MTIINMILRGKVNLARKSIIVAGIVALALSAYFLLLAVNITDLFNPLIARAAVSFNGDPEDFATLRASNYTDFPDSTTNWSTSIGADEGDIVSFAIYYHNTGEEDAQNVRLKILVPGNDGSVITASANLSADNLLDVSGAASVNITSSQHLTYIPGSAKWYPDQSQVPTAFPFGQNGDEVVTSQGVNIGNVAPGWATQGSVVLRFQVSNSGSGENNPISNQNPTADLKANYSDDPITLNDNEDLTLSWSSLNSIFCGFSGTFSSGVGVSGELTITPAHPFYPTSSGSTYTITCDNGFGETSTDTVTVNVSPVNNPVGNNPLPMLSTVDITANSSQGPYFLASNESFTLEWVSSNTVSCTLSSTGVFSSGVAVNDTLGPISPSHPYYPPEGVSRTYTISCDNSSGNTVTDFVTVLNPTEPPQPPQPPQPPVLNVSISNQCGGLIDLSWTIVSGATHYEIYRNGVHILSVSLPQYTDVNLSVGVTYNYVVKAVLGPSNTLASNLASATASPACPVQNPTVDITANSSQGPYFLASNESFTLEWVSSNTVSCTLSSTGVFSSGVAVNDTLGPISPSHPYYPPEGVSRTYTISCDNSSGNTVTDFVTVIRPGNPPQSPLISATTGTQCGGAVNVSWNQISGAVFYKVFRDGNLVATTTSTSFTDAVSVGSTHTYTIKASNNFGDSQISNQAVATASASCPSVPGKPTISAETGTECGGRVFISWTSVSNATFYKIFRDNSLIGTTTSLSFTDTVSPNTSHSYAVKASNNIGDSASSHSKSASGSDLCPLPPPPPPEPTVDLTATPGTINNGQNSTLSWTSNNATSCSATWATSTSTIGFEVVSPATTTAYSITCTGAGGSASDTATINVRIPLPPPDNTCMVPVASSAQSSITFGQSFGSELTLQQILNNNGYSIDALNDQKNYQVWNVSGSASKIKLTIKVIDNQADNKQVFGYFVNGDKNTFQGLFEVGNHTNYALPIHIPGDIVNVEINTLNVSSIGFAIDTQSQNSSKRFYTETQFNHDGEIHTVVYNHASDKYVLAFEDLPKDNYDRDFQDLVVEISNVECIGLQCNEPTFTSPTSANGKIGEVFNYTITSTSTNSSLITYSVATSSLPSGLNFSGNTISGTPSSSGTFEILITATNDCGSSTIELTIVVSPADTPTVILSANPTTINQGATSTLSWISTNTSSCSSIWTTSTSTAGSQIVSPTSTTLYEISCTGPGGAATSSATVTVTPGGGGGGGLTPGVNLVANPSTINLGATSTLSWTGSNVSSCSAPWATSTSTSGTQIVSPATTTEYSIQCSGSNGNASATTTVNVTLSTPSVTLAADPGTINQGATSTLSWISTNTSSCSAIWTTSTSTAGSQIVSPTSTTLYEISCTGPGGAATSSATVTVTPGGGGGGNTPLVTLSANPSSIFAGATSTLSWSSSNVDNCAAPWTTATTTSGSEVVSPATTTDFSILCSGTNGSASATTTITVSAISSLSVILTANPGTISLGATSTLSWVSNNATSCSAPWTTATTTSGFEIVSPATTTAYTITCADSFQNASSTATVSVIISVTIPTPSVTLTPTPGTINQGGSSTLSWSSSNVSSCSAPWTTATSTSGSEVVNPTSTTNYEIVCSGSFGNATGTATVTVSTGGGGGGGGNGGGSSRGSRPGDRIRPIGEVLGASVSCDYLRDYLHIGWNNDPIEVMKLQIFLRELEGFKDLQVTGVFDQATFNAVTVFQVRYQPDILTPWGYAQGEYTGYVYILTKKKVNEIVCQKAFPLNTAQEQEIEQFHAFMESLRSRGISTGISGPGFDGTGGPTLPDGEFFPTTPETPSTTTTTPIISSIGEQFRGVASAILSGPQGWNESLNAILIFLAILLVIYLIITAIVEGQSKKMPLDSETMRERKIFYFLFGLILVVIGSFIFKYYPIILPLLVLVIILAISLLWYSLNRKVSQNPPAPKEVNLEGEE